MPVRYPDSLDKIVSTYFAGVTAQEFTFRGKTYQPKDIFVSPTVFRLFGCPPACGACCPKFSLEWLPDEPRPAGELYNVEFNGNRVTLAHDVQADNSDHFCRNLDKTTGLCLVHEQRPFHCDFEPVRFMHHADHVWLAMKPFGRAWNMQRIDGQRGTFCEFDDAGTVAARADLLRKLRRLEQWTEVFGLKTRLTEIKEWCRSGPHERPLRIMQRGRT